MNTPELREACAGELLARKSEVDRSNAFVGLDGFVDEIARLVDKRDSTESYSLIETIEKAAGRVAAAAGKSTNIELLPQVMKLGGNGPIMANALAALGLEVTYLGALGYPEPHEVFHEFTRLAHVHSIANAGYTTAMEFDDGKVMLSRTIQLNDITWENILERFGKDALVQHFTGSKLVGFVNWTMIPFMSDIWESLLREVCPAMNEHDNILFFDLADPEKRQNSDIRQALEIIGKFQPFFRVVLGLNEKEAYEIAQVLELDPDPGLSGKEQLQALAGAIFGKLSLDTLVVHPVAYALAIDGEGEALVDGPYVARPKITTGAGDHFNAGFCLGRLLGLDKARSLLTGVATSGYYVRNAKSPSVADVAGLIRNWPGSEA